MLQFLQRKPSPPTVGFAREETRIELIRHGYIYRSWGWVEIRMYPHSKSIDICNLVVDPAFQGQGFGKAMVEVIKELAVADSNQVRALCVLEEAKNFWRAQGFKPDVHAVLSSDWIWRSTQ